MLCFLSEMNALLVNDAYKIRPFNGNINFVNIKGNSVNQNLNQVSGFNLH